MSETTCLFDEKPYEVAFAATVLQCEKTEKGYAVVLNQTQFFPEQGGQTPDQGVLGDANVLDVQIENGVITHTVDKELTPGQEVDGKVDWNYRFSNMQQHTGEHLFSGTVHRLFGYNNVGFHLSDSVVTMDFDGVLTEEQVEKVEMLVNEAIASNLPVVVSYPSEEELEILDYRSKKELQGRIRIVTIPGVDVCACCAPHVKQTGEIGMLKVMGVQKYKGGVRISILCGQRALLAFREEKKTLAQLMNLLSSSQEDLPLHMERILQERNDLRYQLAKVKEENMLQKITEIDDTQQDVILFESGLDAKVMRTVVNALVEKHEGVCGVFSGDEENGYTFIVGSKQMDCRKVAQTMREKLQAKGGGSAEMIQGTVPASQKQILVVFQ